MKCPNCGAEIGTNKKCDYCGTTISLDMLREQEQINKEGCPKCGSTNIQFKRENQGEIKSKKQNRVVHVTVGYCKDCGYTWYPQGEEPKKRKTWLWVLGWIFIFPVPLTILLLRKKDMNNGLKYGLIAAAWIVYLLIGFAGNSNDETADTADTDTVINTQDVTEQSHIYDNAEIVDLKSGDGSNVIGTVTITRANHADCTDEALADWYFNYVLAHSDSNYHIVVYSDVDGKGVYGNKGTLQKDVKITPSGKDDSYDLGDDAGSTYYSINEDSKTISVRTVMADSGVINEVASKVDAVIPEEYKETDYYTVDVAGEEGKLDCNIILVGSSLANSDYQALAEDIARKVKELDLGIGYFNMSFKSDNATLHALSEIDDLGAQDVSEISTTTF